MQNSIFWKCSLNLRGKHFQKKSITEYALGRKYTAYDRSIDVHISNLRNKLGDNPQGEPIVKTVRGFGYMFNA
nr:winged helix-turn-helix domain-containing protein [Fluoribacter dumoffii]